MPENPSQPRLFTRRNALIGLGATGVAIAADRFGLFDIFDGRRETQDPRKETVAREKSEPRVPEYEEWAPTIKLPVIELDYDSPPLNQQDKEKLFLPPEIDKEKLHQFYERFDHLKKKVLEDIAHTAAPEKRHQLMFDFVGRLFQEYRIANEIYVNPKDLSDPKKFQKIIAEINYLLTPHNIFLLADHDQEGKEQFVFFDIEEVRELKVEFEEKRFKFSFFFLRNQQNLNYRPDTLSHPFSAETDHHGKYICLNRPNIFMGVQKGIKDFETSCYEAKRPVEPIDPAKIFEDYIKGAYEHEGAHMALDEIKGIVGEARVNNDQRLYTAIKRRGDIKMPHYTVSETEYKNISDRMLHELFAAGFGLMHSGKSAKISAASLGVSDIEGYQYVKYFLMHEVATSPFVDEELKRNLENQIKEGLMTNRDVFAAALSQIPDEGLHHIGERMAKLGLYLVSDNP